MVFGAWDAPTGGAVLSGPVTNWGVAVAGGLFTTVVDCPGSLPGTNLWIEIAVRPGTGGGFTTLSPRQRITPAPLAAYAARAGSVDGQPVYVFDLRQFSTNGGLVSLAAQARATNFILGDDHEARRLNGSWSYTNICVGVSSTNLGTPGGNIALPDWGGLMWASGAAIFDWGGHSMEGGSPHNELQIMGSSKIGIACYDLRDGNAGVQMGGSGPFHDHFWFQYDSSSGQPGLGWSKMIQFVTRSGIQNLYAYSAIQGVAADTQSAQNMIRFYSGLPERTSLGNGSACWAGDVMTNGWNLRGRLVQEHRASTGATNVVLDMSLARGFTVTLTGNASITLTNLSGAQADFEERSIWLKSGGARRTIVFPQGGLRWASESGPAAAPAAVEAGEALVITVRNLGGKFVATSLRSAE